MIVAESLLVEITEEVEGFDAHVRAAQGSLEQTPETLQTVGWCELHRARIQLRGSTTSC